MFTYKIGKYLHFTKIGMEHSLGVKLIEFRFCLISSPSLLKHLTDDNYYK